MHATRAGRFTFRLSSKLISTRLHPTAPLRSPTCSTLSVRVEQVSLTASLLLAPTAAASPTEHGLAVSVALLLLHYLALFVISSTPVLALVAPFYLQVRAVAALRHPLLESAHVLDVLSSMQAQTLAVL